MKVNINNNVDIIDSDHDNNHEQVSTDSTQGVITSTTTTFPGDSVEARGLLYDVITQYIYIYIYTYIQRERERRNVHIYIYIYTYIYIYIYMYPDGAEVHIRVLNLAGSKVFDIT